MLSFSRLPLSDSRRVVAPTLVLLASVAACSQSPEPRTPSPSKPPASAPKIPPASIVHRRARLQESTAGRPVLESIGIVEALTLDSLLLGTDRGARHVALSPTIRLEISRGIHANTGRGAWMGAFIGGIGLGLVGALTCEEEGGIAFYGSSECAAAGVLLGGAGGALVGLVVGSVVKTERWEEVYPEPGFLASQTDQPAP